MKKQYFIVLFLLSTFAISQVKKDSISVNKDAASQSLEETLYSAKDIARIDSLVLENQLQSVFMDEIREYYIPNIDTSEVSEIPLDVNLLKEIGRASCRERV